MQKTARQKEIMRILQDKKRSNVREICETIYCSSATVRRDLCALEEEGLIQTFYGGVMLAYTEERNVPLSVRECESKQIKMRIARKAVEQIPSGASIMLDASSTAMYIADFIDTAQNITVFTNCLRTAITLNERNICVYCIGGLIGRFGLSTTGSFAEQAIRSMHVDMLFFSSQGLDASGTITDNSEEETRLRQLMIKHARQSFFLCHSDKLHQQYLFPVCDISSISAVITNGDISFLPDVKCIQAG